MTVRRKGRGPEEPKAAPNHPPPPELVGPPPLDGIVLVLGERGSGKTLLLQELEARARARACKFVVWDRMGHWKELPRRIVVRCDDVEEAAARAIAEAPCTLLVDEAALAIPSDRPPPAGSAMREILLTGRQARGVGKWRRQGPVALIAAAQRPALVHPNLRSLVDVLYLGRFSAAATLDLEWIAKVTNPADALAATTRPVGQFKRITP